MFNEEEAVQRAKQEGVLFQSAARHQYSGKTVETERGSMRNFASLGYLGLELRPELAEATAAATALYGTQFPFPRAMLECALYRELNEQLQMITGRPSFIGASTTLAHLASLPPLVEKNDAVLVEEGAHSSVHMAAKLVDGVVQRVHLNDDIEELSRIISSLSSRCSKVWLLLDGIASATGSIAPWATLRELVNRFPKLHLYVDEAHSTTWTGKFGRGIALDLDIDPARLVSVLSLNKGFGAAGAAVALPSEAALNRVSRGSAAMFSGAIQPPLLGAAVASANIHLSTTLPQLQSDLMLRIEQVLSLSLSHDIPLVDTAETPLFYVHTGDPDVTFRLVRNLADAGFYVCGVVPPVAPSELSGIRFSVTVHNSPEDILDFISELARSCRELSVEGSAS